MGLRSPQDMQRVGIRQDATTRLQGSRPAQLDKTFLDTASRIVESKAEASRKAKAEQLNFIQTMTDNDAENDVLQANAELAQVKGLNVMDKSIQMRAKLQKAFEKRRNNIAEEYHPYVDQIFAKKITRYNKFAIPYTLNQVNEVKNEVEKTYLANTVNEAIEDSGDPEEFNDMSLAKVTYAAGKAARRQFGESPELIEQAVGLQVSKTVMRAVEQQAVLGQFDKANNLLERHNHELTPADRVKATKLMEQARSDLGDKEASDLAGQAAMEHPDDIQMQELWLRRVSRNDKVLRASTAFLRSRASVEKIAKERKLESTYARINQARNRGEDPMQYVMDLPPGEDREKIFKWYSDTRGGQSVLTDFKAVDELNRRLDDAVTGKDIPDNLIDSYRHRINPRDMQALESKYERLKTNDTREAWRVNKLNYKIVEDRFNVWANHNKLKGDNRNTAKTAVMDEVERVLSINPKITARELDAKIYSTLKARGIQEKPTGKRFWNVFTPETRKSPAENLAPDNAANIPLSFYQEIRRLDPSLTEEQLNIAAQELLRRRTLGK